MITFSDLYRGPSRTFGLTVTSIFPYCVRMCVVVVIVNKVCAYYTNLFSVFERFVVHTTLHLLAKQNPLFETMGATCFGLKDHHQSIL
jgi:type IV secretory pathway TrbD component